MLSSESQSVSMKDHTSGKDALFIAILYVAAYMGLDWLSFICPFAQLNITPWNPSPAVSLALLLRKGFRWAPMLFVAAFLSDIVVRHLPAPLSPTVTTDVAEALVYTTGAWLIRYRFKVDPDLREFRDVVGLLAGTALTSLLMATTYVGAFVATRSSVGDSTLYLVFEYWVGDAIGISVVLPFILISRQYLWQLRPLKSLFTWEALGQVLTLSFALWLVFFPVWNHHTHIFYALFVPLVWVAAKRGLPGVTVMLLISQVAAIFLMVILHRHGMVVTKFQFLMLTLAATSLLLGAAISERQRERERVARGEVRLRTIFDMAPDGMLIIDGDGRIEDANRMFETMCGRPQREVIGRKAGEFITVSRPSRTSEQVLRRHDGTLMPVEMSMSTVPFGNRRTSVVSLHDITERRFSEERKNLHRASLERASRSVLTEEVTATLAHELKQPLSAMIGYAAACRVLLEGEADVPSRALEQMTKAVAQAERAGAIIGRLREFSRGELAAMRPVSLMDIVEQVVALIADELADTGTEIFIDIPADLVVSADNLSIQQVLLNMLRNSGEALVESGIKEGHISISTRFGATEAVTIVVADNGPGIATDIAKNLFHPFTTTRPSGMGLGLAISRSVIERHGGRLWNEACSEGAVFCFTLRLASGADRDGHANS